MTAILGMEVDNHEPSELVELIRPSVPIKVLALNSQGFADFRWQNGADIVQLERKTWNDLLSDLSSVEDQLMRQAESQPLDHRLALLVEGIAVPLAGDITGGTAVLKPSKGKGSIYYESRKSHVSLQALYAWLYQVSKHIEVFQTSGILSTAKAIVAFYSSDQKEIHSTFSRQLKKMEFHSNPQVVSLMGMVPGIGPIKAEALVARFGTVWEILNARPSELAGVYGVGEKEATRWLRTIGRPDV